MGYANQFRAMGFSPIYPAGKENAIVNPHPIPAVRTPNNGGNASLDIAVGDGVSFDNNGNVYRAGSGDVLRGVVVGFRFKAVSTVMNGMGPISEDYSPSGSVDVALVCEDPNVSFKIQSDTFVISQAGKYNLLDAAPDPLYSQSRQSVSIGGGAGAQLMVTDIVNNDGMSNAYGANAVVVARLLQTLNNG